VQLLLANDGNGEAARTRLTHRALIAGGIGACVVIAIAALAMPSASPADSAAAMSAAKSHTLIAVLARTLSEQDQSDPTIRRFAGRVGQDLSQSLASTGVPERQGREYVRLLRKAIQLSNGLSVNDASTSSFSEIRTAASASSFTQAWTASRAQTSS
jgi:hypothetical protein